MNCDESFNFIYDNCLGKKFYFSRQWIFKRDFIKKDPLDLCWLLVVDSSHFSTILINY